VKTVTVKTRQTFERKERGLFGAAPGASVAALGLNDARENLKGLRGGEASDCLTLHELGLAKPKKKAKIKGNVGGASG